MKAQASRTYVASAAKARLFQLDLLLFPPGELLAGREKPAADASDLEEAILPFFRRELVERPRIGSQPFSKSNEPQGCLLRCRLLWVFHLRRFDEDDQH